MTLMPGEALAGYVVFLDRYSLTESTHQTQKAGTRASHGETGLRPEGLQPFCAGGVFVQKKLARR